MNNRQFKSALAVGTTVALVGGAWIVNFSQVQSDQNMNRSHRGEADVNGLLQEPFHRKEPVPYRTEAERRSWIERNQRFAQLWLERQERDVFEEIIPFLNDPDSKLRVRAARALGRLEDPRGVAALQARLQVQEAEGTKEENERLQPIPSVNLNLALGRIGARDLKGQKKLVAVARSVGLSWQDVVKLSEKVNAPKSYDRGSAGGKIVEEIVSLLYSMTKQGENVEQWKDSLLLSSAQQVKLQAAPLPPEQEVKSILDYLASIKIEGEGDMELAQGHLIELGPLAQKLLLQRVEEIGALPEHKRQRIGLIFLLNAIVATGEPRALSTIDTLLKNNTDPIVRDFANRSKVSIKDKLAFAMVPA